MTKERKREISLKHYHTKKKFKLKEQRKTKALNGICSTSHCNNMASNNRKSCAVHLNYFKINATNHRKKLKQELLEYYGNKCICCGESEKVFLSLDHKNNDGAAHRRRLSGDNGGYTYTVYLDIKKQGFPDTFQILCFNCNRAKYVLGKCPHEEAMKTRCE